VRWALNLAFENGYVAGEHAQGGGYAISRAALDAMAGLGLLERAHAWRPFWVSEDVIASALVRAAGFELADFNRPGEVFGVQYRGLPYPPETLVEMGSAVVHSLKHDEVPEQKLRDFFRQLRKSQLPSQSRSRPSLIMGS
jgi:hypothetical protein